MDSPVPLPPLPAQPPQYRDRGTGLVVFGIIEIVLGLFAALGIPFLFLGMVLARKSMGGALPWGNYVNSAVTYGFGAALLVTLGIGCIRAQRWARDLTLILSWIWLVLGVGITLVVTMALPAGMMAGFKAAQASNPNAQPLSPAVLAVLLTFMIAFFAVFAIVLPIIFIWFFRKKDVQETCRRRDPRPRWTEHCPLPVLALGLVFAVGAAYSMLTSITMPMFPFWGRYLTGISASVACLVTAALNVYLAVAFFRLQMAGWWIALVLVVLRMGSNALTALRGNLLQAYSRMGWSDAQLEAMRLNPMMRGNMMLVAGLLGGLLFLGYLVWARRYFVRPSVPASPVSDPLLQAP